MSALDASFIAMEADISRSNPRPVVDQNGTFAMCLIGRPDSQSYLVDCSNVLDVMQEVGDRAQFESSQTRHKRGTFPAVNSGFVAGQGQTKPTPMVTGKAAPIVEELLSNTSVQRIMAFQSGKLSGDAVALVLIQL